MAARRTPADAVASAVIAFDVLFQGVGQRYVIVAPVGVTDRRASTRGGFADRLGSRRPAVDALVAESAARKRAEAAGIDPDDEPEVAEARGWCRCPVTCPAVSMAWAMTRCVVCGVRVHVHLAETKARQRVPLRERAWQLCVGDGPPAAKQVPRRPRNAHGGRSCARVGCRIV